MGSGQQGVVMVVVVVVVPELAAAAWRGVGRRLAPSSWCWSGLGVGRGSRFLAGKCPPKNSISSSRSAALSLHPFSAPDQVCSLPLPRFPSADRTTVHRRSSRQPPRCGDCEAPCWTGGPWGGLRRARPHAAERGRGRCGCRDGTGAGRGRKTTCPFEREEPLWNTGPRLNAAARRPRTALERAGRAARGRGRQRRRRRWIDPTAATNRRMAHRLGRHAWNSGRREPPRRVLDSPGSAARRRTWAACAPPHQPPQATNHRHV